MSNGGEFVYINAEREALTSRAEKAEAECASLRAEVAAMKARDQEIKTVAGEILAAIPGAYIAVLMARLRAALSPAPDEKEKA